MRFEGVRRAAFHLSRNPLSIAAAVLVALVAFLTVTAPLVAPYPTHAGAVVDFANASKSPSGQNLFGTDNVGRDILSRSIFGLRTSLWLALVILIIAVPAGTIVGLVAGYFGVR